MGQMCDVLLISTPCCMQRRVDTDRAGKRRHVDQTLSHGWLLMGRPKLDDLLGISGSEALPGRTVDSVEATYSSRCSAENAYHDAHQVKAGLARKPTILSAAS